MRYREPLTVPILLDRDPVAAARCPLHEQIVAQVGAAVEQGRLTGGMRLPSTRTLASLLGVSRGVANAAYAALLERGYLEARQGSGTYVAGRNVATNRHRRPAPPVDLVPGRTIGEAFPQVAWRLAWRRATSVPPVLPHPLGLAELRTAVAAHIRHTMGVSLDAHTVVITSGVAQSLRLVLEAWQLGGARVALEEPVPIALRRAVPGDPVPFDPADSAMGDFDAVVLAPDGQVPLAQSVSPERRLAIVDWARRTGGRIITVASPALPQPDAVPPPSLLVPDTAGSCVIVGDVCDQLGPALQLGYAVVPVELAGPIGRLLDGGPSPVAQLAAAHLLRDGTVARLSRRLAPVLAGKRRLLTTALGPLPFESLGVAVWYLPEGTDAEAMAAALHARGVAVRTLASYHWTGRPVRPALVLGYGHVPVPALRHALSVILSSSL